MNGDTDLDILFDPAQRAQLDSVLSSCGLKRFRSSPRMQYNAIEDFIGFDQATAKIWHIHTHYQMTLGEPYLKGYTITPWGSLLLSNRIRGEANIWTSSPSEELVLKFCRIALKLRWRDQIRKLKIKKDDLQEINWLKDRVSRDQLALSADLMVKEKSKEIILQLYDTELVKRNQFTDLQKKLRNEFRYFTGYHRFSSWSARTFRELAWLYGGIKRRKGWGNYYPRSRVSPSGGLVVSFLGYDGEGKKAILSSIKKEFGKKLDVVSFNFESGKDFSKSRGNAVARIYRAVSLAKEKKRKQAKMVRARNNGFLVLTNGYPHAVPGLQGGPLLSQYREKKGILKRIADWEEKIYESFSINAPDLTVKLVIPAEPEPGMAEKEIENLKRSVTDLDIADHTVIIDPTRDLHATCAEEMREIWNLI